ncbi:amino acid permease 2-like [Vicia villosa]|uniref:amino acid permease 2-like n=1 Tax=Vicia villosa TaxID=3911 RepID=UPI00273A8A43|nr:amino acid permease 2-like [Vicia villosa]
MNGNSSLQITRTAFGAYDDDGHTNRTGNVKSVMAHIITVVIVYGVLSLAWSISYLGWIVGPLALLCCATATCISSSMLSDCYRNLDLVTGKRNHSYIDAVRVNLGTKRTYVTGLLQFSVLYGTLVAYVITAAASLRAIVKSNCYHKEGRDAPCSYDGNLYTVLFGLAQILMSFIPNLHDMAWVSIVAAIMSFSYSFIRLGLGIATVMHKAQSMGSVTGAQTANDTEKVWFIFQALGDISFSYPYSTILLEIQDTLVSPPSESLTMKKASMISMAITTSFYLCCGCFGYTNFGNAAPGNLLTGFSFYEPFWLINTANVCIIIHLVGGYEVLS